MKEINFKYSEVTKDFLRAMEKPGKAWALLVGLMAAGVLFGGYLWLEMMRLGMGKSGLNHPVGWGVFITDFVFWVGIGHAGTLISAILFLFRARWRNAIFRSAEAMTIDRKSVV